MVAINRKQVDDSPVIMPDEGWWESVLSDEQHLAITPSGRENLRQLREHPDDKVPAYTPASGPPHPDQNTARQVAKAPHRQAKPSVQAEPSTALSQADWADAIQV